MDTATHSAKPWRVLVASCDAYSDLWPFFFHFLFQYWPEVPQPVYLVSNHLTYDDPRVKTLPTGPDDSWGACMQRALHQVGDEPLLFMLDDFLLSTPVDHAKISHFIQTAIQTGAPYLALDGQSDLGQPIGDGQLHATAPGERAIGLNLSFWQKEFLLSVTQPGLNIWQAERRLKDFALTDPRPFLISATTTPLVVHYVESVRGRFWKPMGRDHLLKHGLRFSSLRRPCPPQDESGWSRFVRSTLKRYMTVAHFFRALYFQSTKPKIQPL